MEEIINRIVAYAKQQAKELPLQDQALVYQELEGRMSDLNLQALHDDYLADGLYCWFKGKKLFKGKKVKG